MHSILSGNKKEFSSACIIPYTLCFILISFLCVAQLYAQTEENISYDDIPIWRNALGGAVIGHPVAQVESVIAATDGGNLRSYSSQGKLLWDFYSRGRLTPHISRSREGTSYICRSNGLLIAINRSGRELWQLDLKSPIVYPVISGWDGRLFVFTEKKITCMTAAGYTLWSKTLDAKMASGPILDSRGGIITILESGELLKIDPFGRTFSFQTQKNAAANQAASLPVVIASLEIPEQGHAILLLYQNRLMELFHSSGIGETLKLQLPSAPLAAMARKNEAAVLLKDGRIALISIGNAEKLSISWTEASHTNSNELSGPDACDLLFDERGIYVLTKSGATGFTSDGRKLWTIKIKGAAAIPSFGDDGVLYSGGADWILYAYRLEDRVRAKQRLLYGEMPEGSYGTGNPPSSWIHYYPGLYEEEMEERLAEIRQAIKTGSVGERETEYTSWLMEIAGSISANIAMARLTNRELSESERPPAPVIYRIEAAKLLAFIGSRETIPFLSSVFIRDNEVLVKAAAAEAIGKIGVDPDGLAIRAFENAILPPLRIMDETVLSSLATATGALCRFSGPPLSDAGVRILTVLSVYDRMPIARNQARRELASLRN